MKRCLGFVLVIVSGVSDGTSIAMSLRASPVLGKAETIDATSEVDLLVQQHQASMTHNDIQGIENILGAFAQMIGSFAMVMANLESPTIAAASVSSIVTNAFKVILELAKHKSIVLDSADYDLYPLRGNNLPYTLEVMEQELLGAHEIPHATHNPKAQVILSSFASILDNCANIAGDPHNPKIVGSNLAGLFARIIDIAVAAKRHGVVLSPAVVEEFTACVLHDEEVTHILCSIMKHKAARARLLRLSACVENAQS